MPTTLVVKLDKVQGCVRSFVIQDQERILPGSGETRTELGVLQVDYACDMGRYTGVINVG
ncbi:hypothetical protein [Lentzea aerocolonigenes]|uniref:hypothetical protein n=1 Tax=Lentzea aerocolonigenes TaxID=68170 RepID=UPI0012E18D91|nr:hypothetical protein [Lentzea aerocolonigenes]